MSLPIELKGAAARSGDPAPVMAFDRDRAERIAETKPPMHFTARVHHDPANIESVWTSLQADGASTAYQGLDWINCVRDFLVKPAGAAPIFVEVVDMATDTSVMIAPLVVVRRFSVKVISWFDLGVCDYAAPLMAPGLRLSREDSGRAWAAVRKVLPKVDLIDIRHIPSDIAGTPNPIRLLPQCVQMDVQAFGMAISGDAETLLSRIMGGKNHRGLWRCRRRLSERGQVRFVEAKTEEDLETLFAVMMDQRRRRFEDLGRFDLLARPEIQAFYKAAAIRSLNGHGPARLFGLAVDDEWVSCSYVLVQSGTIYGIILTIGDEKWKKQSPGLLMVAALAEWAVDNAYSYFDMTVGNLAYKSDFGAEAHTLGRLLEARSLRGLIAKLVSEGTSEMMKQLRRHPKLFKDLRTLRQSFRRSVFKRS